MRRLRLTPLAALGALTALLVAAPGAGAAVWSTDIGSARGPLTQVTAGADLSCQAQFLADAAPSFAPPGAAPADCGTIVAVDGQLYAPDFAAHGATSTGALGSYAQYAQAGQVADGANAVDTTVSLPSSGLQIVQRDSYLPGQDAYRTDVTVKNTGTVAKNLVLYRAGDCHLQGPGTGYGFSGSPAGSVGCSAQPGNSPLDRVIQWVPIGGGPNNWMQGSAADVWSQIATRNPLPDQCLQCTNESDAAAALSWSIALAPGGAETRSHWTVVSPTGRTGPPLPAPPPPPVEPVTTTVQGTAITFTGPTACVRPPARYGLRVTSIRKKRISHDRFGYVRRVRILRVDFLVDAHKRATDKRASFKALLPSAGAAAGEHSLTARVLLQPLRQRGRQKLVGKKFTRTLTSAVNICP